MCVVKAGSEGKLSFPYQRDGMINSLRALSNAPGGKTLTQLAATICLFLMSYYKEDGMLKKLMGYKFSSVTECCTQTV